MDHKGNYSDFPSFRVMGGKKSHFIQVVQTYTSPNNSFDRLLPMYVQVKSIEECIRSTYQALSSVRITGFTVVVALTWHTRCYQSVRLSYTEFCMLSSVVSWSTALVVRGVK